MCMMLKIISLQNVIVNKIYDFPNFRHFAHFIGADLCIFNNESLDFTKIRPKFTLTSYYVITTIHYVL